MVGPCSGCEGGQCPTLQPDLDQICELPQADIEHSQILRWPRTRVFVMQDEPLMGLTWPLCVFVTQYSKLPSVPAYAADIA